MIGPAFAVRTRTENQNQASFCPFALREVSVPAELALGHLRYILTASVVTRLFPKKGHGHKNCVLPPRRHISVRERTQSERYANRASETQPDERGPQSQSLSRSYGSNLPTSLTYIVLVTRGCSPWRPDADIGTARHENHRLSLGFARARKGVPGTTRETRCSFEAACPYLGMTPFQGLRTSYEEKKISLPWCLHGRLRVRLRYRTRDRGLIYFVSGIGNLNPITFRPLRDS
ncbi:uncharacterized protein NPIL_606441 [Nephila pilipes]|uniref:Uncharacterized protein n=1 Tax=Nephila pilipes TaxID=299642 RepID=A0A8X6IFZ0_NEPPI|nr:uncharacterized protein NPIL_439631 [Nephila pilipes]GFT49988.1 uncharacterized protein NPIL_606441 [Nephila pilipes]